MRGFWESVILAYAAFGLNGAGAQETTPSITETCKHDFRHPWDNYEIATAFIKALNAHDYDSAGKYIVPDTKLYDVGEEKVTDFKIPTINGERLEITGLMQVTTGLVLLLDSPHKTAPTILLLYMAGGCIFGAAESYTREEP
jgi:hypothetical protein